ncbi:TonB-dependent receptor [Paraurantiacibacter namhicola]|uniref:Pesticin receptor n=1 Tax=Paraurantiacibacter namhicola TaxID=645517 RepID=A0A1C7DA49_9SPHN|nr:TonB-dependent receptor [Paraurantiacibacter namhicola]ANU08366.1 Pesticin receptor precursor [Paraurantiacibacter namhicola]
MNMRFLAACGVSLAVLAAIPASAKDEATHAKPRPDSPEPILTWHPTKQEIVVTASREGLETLENYTGGISVFTDEELEARAFTDLSSLSYSAPNVSLDPIGTFRGVSNFAIRGLGVNSSIPTVEPTVGVFVDGVYIGVNAGTVFDALDVERVEILRGPQGTSFGRNTTGGAVLVQTADPSTSWEGHARATLEGPVDGGRGRWAATGRAVLSGPISDTVSFRLGALHSSDPGYFRNSVDGQAFGEMRTTVLRGGLAFNTTDVSVVGKLEWTGSHGDGAATHNNGLFARDTFEIAVNQRGFYRSDSVLGTVKAEVELGEGTLTDTFGYRDYSLETRNDIDSTPVPIFESDTATAHRQWSNELTYRFSGDGWTGIAGIYLLDQEIGYDESRDLSFFGAAPQFGGGVQDHTSLGLFAQGTLYLTQGLAVQAGLRWSRETKRGEITYVRPRAACSSIDGTCPVTGTRVAGENNGFKDERTWEALSPSITLQYEPNSNALLYASWARGHRSGGYNPRITQPAQFEDVSARLGSFAFDQERVDTFELGGNWQPSRDFSVRGAIFRTYVDDLQRELSVPSLNAGGLAQSIYNTADARIDGLELEVTARPAIGLQLGAHLGLLDADYTEVRFDLTGDGVIDGADLALELPRAPKLSLGGSVGYETSVGDSDVLSFYASFQHRGRYAYTDNNWGWNDASNRLDASISYLLGGSEADVTLRIFGRNLLDEVQFGGDTQLPFGGGPFSNGVAAPFDPRPAAGTFSPLLDGRTIGVEVGVAF